MITTRTNYDIVYLISRHPSACVLNRAESNRPGRTQRPFLLLLMTCPLLALLLHFARRTTCSATGESDVALLIRLAGRPPSARPRHHKNDFNDVPTRQQSGRPKKGKKVTMCRP